MDDNQNITPPAPKMYFGNLREKQRLSGDKFLVGSFCKEDIDNIPLEHFHKGKNGKHYFDVIINPFKNGVNEYGNTHSASLDTFKPNKDNNNTINNEVFK